jgi:exodeoxyribonuclease VII large subunit
MNDLFSNVPEFSVSSLAGAIKKTLEGSFERIRVRGELSKISMPSSGHLYTTLKDDQAAIDAVCWKGTLGKLSLKPVEGMEVIVTGRMTSYAPRSSYQLIIEDMELAGQGALLKMLEDRRKALAAEGLFDENRKKTLPFLPKIIGVVTSPTGAVIRDIMHRLDDRFPRHVLLWPVMVQGQGAAEQVAAAIDGFNRLGSHIPKPDLIIVARGGGSLEDLMPFNEECVVRAVANSVIPIISAIGHETDTTLIDYAADQRAPTPTGAAEMAVPRRMDLLYTLDEYTGRLHRIMDQKLTHYGLHIQNYAAKLIHPATILDTKSQHLDLQEQRMTRFMDRIIAEHSQKITQKSAKLVHPMHRLKQMDQSLDQLGARLSPALERYLEKMILSLQATDRVLSSLSFENILQRGFAVVRDAQGHVIENPDQLVQDQEISVLFKDKKQAKARIVQ